MPRMVGVRGDLEGELPAGRHVRRNLWDEGFVPIEPLERRVREHQVVLAAELGDVAGREPEAGTGMFSGLRQHGVRAVETQGGRRSATFMEDAGEFAGAASQVDHGPAGARFDDNQGFADATTWNLALSYDFADSGYRLHASAGTEVISACQAGV